MRHQIGVGNQYTRRIGVSFENTDRFARLDQQRFVILQPFEHFDNFVVTVPVTRCSTDTAVDDQLLRAFRDLRVEIVHQHAQGRFGQPAFGAYL